MDMTFSDTTTFIKSVRERLTYLGHPYDGAHFRAAFARTGDSFRFLTGCALFRERHIPSRQVQDYGWILFAEEWVREEDQAIERLNGLINGRQKIAEYSIPGVFSQTDLQKQVHLPLYRWMGWRYLSRLDPRQGEQQTYISQEPLLAFGLPPHLGAAGAISEWVFETDLQSEISSTAPNQGCWITMLPETRARLKSAEWVPGLLRVEIEPGVAEDQLQLQLLYSESGKKCDLLNLGPGPIETEVPPDARQVFLFLMHQSGECLAQLRFSGPYQAYGKAKETLTRVQQAVADLAGGECDNIEYKPFIRLKDQKEIEIVETVIAFANTNGGRLYVGVEDDGRPQGETIARTLFQKEASAALEAQGDRIKSLLRERMKPVLLVKPEIVEAVGFRFVVVEVERGSDRPYSTHDNKVFVRKGATNKLADPQTDLPGLVSRPGLNWR